MLGPSCKKVPLNFFCSCSRLYFPSHVSVESCKWFVSLGMIFCKFNHALVLSAKQTINTSWYRKTSWFAANKLMVKIPNELQLSDHETSSFFNAGPRLPISVSHTGIFTQAGCLSERQSCPLHFTTRSSPPVQRMSISKGQWPNYWRT